MIENADEVVNCIAEKIREILRTKEYGTFGITITMHEGQPLKICEQNEINKKIMWSGVFVKVWERLKGASNREAA